MGLFGVDHKTLARVHIEDKLCDFEEQSIFSNPTDITLQARDIAQCIDFAATVRLIDIQMQQSFLDKLAQLKQDKFRSMVQSDQINKYPFSNPVNHIDNGMPDSGNNNAAKTDEWADGITELRERKRLRDQQLKQDNGNNHGYSRSARER